MSRSRLIAILIAVSMAFAFSPTALGTYEPVLGRWIERDPKGYIDGANTYQYARSRPAVGFDPMGLEVYWYENINCEILKGCGTHPMVQQAQALFAAQCGSKKVVVTCLKPLNPFYGDGQYCCGNSSIEIRKDAVQPCVALAHEIMHAADHCSFGDLACPQDSCDLPPTEANCDYYACTEARANGYTNCCTDPDGGTWETCMERRKKRYAEAMPKCNADKFSARWDMCAPYSKNAACSLGILPCVPSPLEPPSEHRYAGMR